MTLQNLNYKQLFDVASTEAQRIIEQTQLDAAKNSTERNRLGQFATPNPLAIEIINYSKLYFHPIEKFGFEIQ
jgi:adenine-specific DNA-methyltransferase